MVDVTVPPEIPLKILNVFTDQDGDIRVKEDNLREVLSRFRNYSRDITVQVLSTLRGELADQVGAVKDNAELARAQLAEDLTSDLASKDVLAEVEELARGAHAKADMLGVQLKSLDGRLRQMAAVSQANSASASADDLAMTAPAVMSSASLQVEPTPSETFRAMPTRGSTFSPKSDSDSVTRSFTSRSNAQAQQVEPAPSTRDVEHMLSSQEALWKEAVAKVKEEVADLAAKQEELEKSLQASASSSDLEASVQALREAQTAAEQQMRLDVKQDLLELRQLAKQASEDDSAAMTSNSQRYEPQSHWAAERWEDV
ncbi:unnamed protein product [Symbiodinium natans]|uniref:Uncharacterized protein n=1 Tax=Symbiodinium natans TaxID=878477 RepID=A0A812KCR9_9DINO|nr:unnamed protein product [Symbiodinium natans]